MSGAAPTMAQPMSPAVRFVNVCRRFGSVPSVPAACKGNELLTDTGCTTNGFDNFEKIWFWRTPTAKCEKEGACVPYSQWAKDYIAILGK